MSDIYCKFDENSFTALIVAKKDPEDRQILCPVFNLGLNAISKKISSLFLVCISSIFHNFATNHSTAPSLATVNQSSLE